MIAFLLDFVIENMLMPGHVENWVVISDFEKNGFGELGFGSLKQVMGILTDNYRCRLGCNYVVNPAKIVYYMWSCMKPFLDDVLIEKVKILNKPHPEELFSHCNPYQVEEKYGGKAPNAHVFWPPIMPKAPYSMNGILLHDFEEVVNKSFESQENPVEESEFSPKRRSLSTSNAFEVKMDFANIKKSEIETQHENIHDIEEHKEDEMRNDEENEKRLRKERRKLRRMKKELRRKEKEQELEQTSEKEEIVQEEIVLEKKTEKIQLMSEIMDSERCQIDSDFDLPSKSPIGIAIPSDIDNTTYESNKVDVGCGICTTLPSMPKVKACLLF